MAETKHIHEAWREMDDIRNCERERVIELIRATQAVLYGFDMSTQPLDSVEPPGNLIRLARACQSLTGIDYLRAMES